MATSHNPPSGEPGAFPGIAKPGFAELHCVSNYSFLRGGSHPEELVERAAALGYEAIAITDECSFAGLVKAHMAAKEHGIKLIVGAEFELEEGIRLVLLAPDRDAYGQLAGLITRLRRRSPKGEYTITLDDLSWGIDECFALWAPALADIQVLIGQGRRLQALLPSLWVALELFHDAHDLDKTANALTISMRLDLPIVAANNVHTHVESRQPLQDLMTAIRLKTTVAELGQASLGNGERHLRSIDSLCALYPREMLVESCEIAARCRFSMDELRYEYPEELVPPHLTPGDYLRQLTMAGAAERWPQGIPADVSTLVERELALIHDLSFEYYFLTVQDIVQFARSQRILCQGRGSAANSAVCYCLHITEVDPSRMHLLFERFVSKERDEPPDIDVDFEHERREEVIQYIYKRYGRERAALAATLITYRLKSAVRDVGKALGMDLDLVDLLAKSLAWWDKREELDARLRTAGLDPQSQVVVQFLHLINEILGFPRHLSQHVGGFVISRGPLAQLVPVENAAMEDRTVIQWDKDDLEALGLLKVDVLGLGMLTAIRKALDALNACRGSNLAVATIPAEDPATYRMLQEGDSVGVFQVESRAQMAMLPRLKPQHFYDLVIEVAIVRPGPIQGDMVHPYLRRRQGLEKVTYSSDGVRKVLERTLGVPIFQEQVIELAMVAAGFTGGEADQLRRAMAAWRRRGGLEHFEQKLIDGMLARGHDREFAERVFRQIQGFGEYGFPESHAASFALLVYVSAWLKRHAPAAFYCGLLNSLPMGFYSPSQLVQDAGRHRVDVQPADVQYSTWDHHLEPEVMADPGNEPALRLGLRMVKGLSEEIGRRIEAHQPYRSAEDLARRADLSAQNLRFLARAGVLKSLSGHRYQAHWEVAGIQPPMPLDQIEGRSKNYDKSLDAKDERGDERSGKQSGEQSDTQRDEQSDTQRDERRDTQRDERRDTQRDERRDKQRNEQRNDDKQNQQHADIQLPAPTTADEMFDDYRYMSLTLGPHPLRLLRGSQLLEGYRTAHDLEACRHGQMVKIGGLVTGRQRPGSASGVLFVTLEDETGNVNVVVWASVLQRFRAALLQGQLLRIKGVVEREKEVIHVVAGYVEDSTHLLSELADSAARKTPFKSRDFK